LRQSVSHQEFQLPGFVAAESEAGEIVAFDQDPRRAVAAAEGLAEPGELVERGRESGQQIARLVG
jgi:hypothetical protein